MNGGKRNADRTRQRILNAAINEFSTHGYSGARVDRIRARARANTRFPSATVARMVGEQDQVLVTGSYAVPGAYTREAWEKFVQEAFRNAANRELQSTDWVLKTAARDDLTLEGSPEQIQKGLTELYLAERAASWGEMPLHVWLRAVIKDPSAIAGIEELLGAAPAAD